MTTFPITQAIRTHRSFVGAILDVLPDLTLADMRCDNHTLTILRQLTPEQASAISNSIAAIEQAIALKAAAARQEVDTFAWMNSQSARQWWRTLNPHGRN